MLIDTYGRVATDLRVSLTDRCNLRCTYCMPEEDLPWPAKPDLLTDDEIVRLIAIAVTSLGIEEVRFTG
ncbi:radical SAM protein, partial [Streptomyces sp. NPDC012616]|uniref:radical SAM protein n=1 Tax=Streptomyces sp. NPDC012616 TaxID=3364840 RepID=UPI0036DFC8BC